MANAPDHIVVVVEENDDYHFIIGNPSAPYINSLADNGALFTDYQGITNPSQPNYLALYSGSTQGVTDNRSYSFDQPTLGGQLEAAGLSFLGYAEADAPRKHIPWDSFEDSQDLGRDFDDFPTNFDDLPTVSFVTPDNAHDMHDGSVGQGDDWLEANLGDYAEWAEDNNSLLIVTFDEGQDDGENHIPLIVYGDGVVAGEYDQPGNHYDLLRTIEKLLRARTPGPRRAGRGPGVRSRRDHDHAAAHDHAAPDDHAAAHDRAIADGDPRDRRGGRAPGTNAGDEVSGLAGDDLLVGQGGDDVLLGGTGDDRLRSGTGGDTLNGGDGQDRLFGGDDDAGGDTFDFDAWDESTAGGDHDVIHHFVSAEDRIDLRNIDALPASGANDAFAWGGQNAADHAVWWKGTANGILLPTLTGQTPGRTHSRCCCRARRSSHPPT